MLYIAELSLYWFALILIATKIYNYSLTNKTPVWIHAFCYGLLIFFSFALDHAFFIYIFSIFQVIQLILIRFSFRDFKLPSIAGTYFFLYSFNIIVAFSIQCVVNFDTPVLRYMELLLNFLTFIGCTLLCTIPRFSTATRQIVLTLPRKVKLLTVFAFATNAVLMPLFFSNPILNDNSSWSQIIRILLFFLSLFICTVFPILLITSITNIHLRRQARDFEQNLQIQADHYATLAKSNFELRRFRHDFKNVKIGLSKYIEQQDIPSALALLESGEDTMRAAEDILPFDCGNGIIDALLADKQTKALDKNISIRFDGAIPSLSKLAPIDLCVIFGNTIDNAVEACEQLLAEQEKVIQISAQCSCGFLFIKIQNPTAAPVVIRNNMITTTKNDRSAHGFGLYSLEQTIKKYDGTIKLSYENYIFTLEITLPLC